MNDIIRHTQSKSQRILERKRSEINVRETYAGTQYQPFLTPPSEIPKARELAVGQQTPDHERLNTTDDGRDSYIWNQSFGERQTRSRGHLCTTLLLMM